MRLNNFSARLIVNDWLARTGRAPLPSDLSYEQFATRLREITAPAQVQVPFASRADAVAYIRHVATANVKSVPEPSLTSLQNLDNGPFIISD
ncbi:hypothetical protein L598_000700001150 [Mesorhizobium sp. J18]|nr:hypothetical protein L598_000700001150 [Mesorhizobium sp. J18]